MRTASGGLTRGGDATLGFYVIGYACREVAVALASNDGIIDGCGDEYGLRGGG